MFQYGMLTVAAGVIERDGRILIAQRRADGPHPGKWEFPGGKVEPGEAPREALARELREELGVEAAIGEELTRYQYAYPGKTPILLVFFQVEDFEGVLENRIFAALEWVKAGELAGFDFLEGDAAFIAERLNWL